MNYNEAISYINDKDKLGSKLGLDKIRKLLEILGNPQDELEFIHLAGTNGKGSTSAYLSTCLMEAGYSVGLFTSPFLERFNERISLDGLSIPDDDLSRLTSKVRKAISTMLDEGFEHPTTFEIVTAIAFLYFKEEGPDYVVLEVGLGGRYDSTNIIKKPVASVITTIAFDHVNELGDTLPKIAYQKAGIIKEEGLVVSYPQDDEVIEVLKDVTEEKDAELIFSNNNVEILEETDRGSKFNFQYGENKFLDAEISMLGEYQIYNATLAITTLLALRDRGIIEISNEEIYKGIYKTKWKARLEVLSRDPIFLIDGAHNLQGARNLSKALELFDYDKLILGVSILKDKDVESMLDQIVPLADTVIATEVYMPRKLSAEDLGKKLNKYKKDVIVEKDIRQAILKAISLAGEDDMIVFGGSLYLVGEVRTIVNLL